MKNIFLWSRGKRNWEKSIEEKLYNLAPTNQRFHFPAHLWNLLAFDVAFFVNGIFSREKILRGCQIREFLTQILISFGFRVFELFMEFKKSEIERNH